MSTDRELLELAAKAAGIEGEYFEDAGGDYGISTGGTRIWNPLEWDGDALRLAVKLEIWPVRYEKVIIVQRGTAYFDEIAECSIDDDPYAATRRAIVRAAAEIGKIQP